MGVPSAVLESTVENKQHRGSPRELRVVSLLHLHHLPSYGFADEKGQITVRLKKALYGVWLCAVGQTMV